MPFFKASTFLITKTRWIFLTVCLDKTSPINVVLRGKLCLVPDILFYSLSPSRSLAQDSYISFLLPLWAKNISDELGTKELQGCSNTTCVSIQNESGHLNVEVWLVMLNYYKQSMIDWLYPVIRSSLRVKELI